MATQVTLNSGSVDSAGSLALKTNGTTTAVTINASQGVEFNAGAVGTPSITTTGDTNTGIFFPAADTIAFSEGGTEAMRINSSGNVGIGTSSPAYKLDMTVTAANNAGMRIYNSTAGTGNGCGISFSVANGFSSTNQHAAIQALSEASGNTLTSLAFYTSGSSNTGNATERARIDSSGNLLFNSGYGSVATAYGCRAWVNFNGTGTPAIRGSGNVSSITDGGTGTFSVNFTTSMPDQNYSAVGSAVNSSSSLVGITSAGNIQTPYFDIRVTNDAGSLQDPNFCCYAVFR